MKDVGTSKPKKHANKVGYYVSLPTLFAWFLGFDVPTSFIFIENVFLLFLLSSQLTESALRYALVSLGKIDKQFSFLGDRITRLHLSSLVLLPRNFYNINNVSLRWAVHWQSEFHLEKSCSSSRACTFSFI